MSNILIVSVFFFLLAPIHWVGCLPQDSILLESSLTKIVSFSSILPENSILLESPLPLTI